MRPPPRRNPRPLPRPVGGGSSKPGYNAVGIGREPLRFEPMPYMEEYLEHLRSRLLSRAYIHMVRVGLIHFSHYCQERNLNHTENIKRSDIVGFVSWIGQKEWKDTYQSSLQYYVRTWLNWCAENEYLEHGSPWVRIPIKQPRRPLNPITPTEVSAVFLAHRRQAFRLTPFVFHRREVILALLFGWGLQVAELEALNLANMDLRLPSVTIRRGKILPYPLPLKEVIQRWVNVRPQHAEYGEDALLINFQGKRLTSHRIREIVTASGTRAGVDLSPRDLRDSHALELVDAEISINHIAKLLGNKNLEGAKHYASHRDEKIAQSHAKAMNARLRSLLWGKTSDLL